MVYIGYSYIYYTRLKFYCNDFRIICIYILSNYFLYCNFLNSWFFSLCTKFYDRNIFLHRYTFIYESLCNYYYFGVYRYWYFFCQNAWSFYIIGEWKYFVSRIMMPRKSRIITMKHSINPVHVIVNWWACVMTSWHMGNLARQ